MEELPDESWELLVLDSYLLKFKGEVAEVFLGCNVETDYNPLEPNKKEIKEFGVEKAKSIRVYKFHSRVQHMMNEGRPKAAAIYSQLLYRI